MSANKNFFGIEQYGQFANTICCGTTVVDNHYIEPQTEVKHGQICCGDKIAKKTPEGNNYCFEAGT